MFRGVYQKKLLTILYSGGSSPLEIWDIQVKNGWTRRVKDEELGCIVFEICGTNVATAYIISPPDPKAVLGITLPFITMFIKNLKRYFTFEIQILDDKQMRRRFRFSNYQSSTKVRPFTCSVPLALKPGWNQMQLNLANFTTRAYGTNYMETQRVQIHANCRIRRVYFSDRLYAEEELPRDYRIYLNVRQAPQQPPSQEPSALKVESSDHAEGQISQPHSILKATRVSAHGVPSELMARTSFRSASVTSTRAGTQLEPRASKSATLIPPEEQTGEGEEPRASVHSVGSRKSQRTSSKLEERRSMGAIVEEKEPQSPEVEGGEGGEGGEGAEGAEGVEGGEAIEGAEHEAKPEKVEAEGESDIPVESPEESPRVEEEAPSTEVESPRTDETESPRSDMVESEVAESEPIPESDAEVPESGAEEVSPEPPPTPEVEEPPTE